MKQILITSALVLCAFCSYGQTSTHRNHIGAGFGFQQYNGDLGNTFYSTDEEWYGVGRLSYSRYLGHSFDLHIFGTMGDLGHCNDDEVNNPGALNMRSRMNAAVISLKYKFANGYLLKEDAKLAPYLYLGTGISNLRDIWITKDRVNKGNYNTVNAGLGLSYRLTERFDIAYNIGLGYFTSDALDFISEGSNDMYLQNTLSVGFNF